MDVWLAVWLAGTGGPAVSSCLYLKMSPDLQQKLKISYCSWSDRPGWGCGRWVTLETLEALVGLSSYLLAQHRPQLFSECKQGKLKANPGEPPGEPPCAPEIRDD